MSDKCNCCKELLYDDEGDTCDLCLTIIDFNASQEPLSVEFESVLNDNYWELYESHTLH